MNANRARRWWVSAVGALSGIILLSGCATIAGHTAEPASQQASALDEDDWSELTAQLRSDLNRYNSRELARTPVMAPVTRKTASARDSEFAEHARALFAPLSAMSLRMPVIGIRPRDLSDSWHDPRDGGVRWHKGIDIFAPRGTEVIAVADGIVSYIGEQPKGGHCLWLTTESGTAFYYAHLDRWAPGLYEGMEVQAGDLLGFVGNTGNAIHTPSHLHFGINRNDEMVDPYPLLARATISRQARRHVELGGGFGTR